MTSPCVILKGLGGKSTPPGSLNFFINLVGEPGDGKDAAMAASTKMIDLGDVTDPFGDGPEESDILARLGSGEGLAHIFRHRAKGGELVWDRRRALIMESEVESLTTLGGRQGSTLLSELRTVWTGGRLGHAYVDPKKRIPVPANSYRLAAIVAVQPGNAGPILADTDKGMPQRFVWLMCADRNSPDNVDDLELTAMQLTPAFGQFLGHEHEAATDPREMVVFDGARQEINRQRRGRLRREPGYEALHGHWLLAKLKVAALLAILHGEEEVTEQWWGLADWVMKRSDEGEAYCRHFSIEQENTKEENVRKRRVRAATAEASAVDEQRMRSDTRDELLEKLDRRGEWWQAKVESSWVRRKLVLDTFKHGRRRDLAEAELEKLVSEGTVRTKLRKARPNTREAPVYRM